MKLLLASELTACLPKIRAEIGEVKPGSRLLVIPTAAIGEGWMPEYETHFRPFEEMGFFVDGFDLQGKTKEETAAALGGAQAVYVSGGNTFFLLEHMRRSGFFELIRERVESGLTYVGSSAGAVATADSITYAESLDDRSRACLDSDEGLDLVPFRILPHMDHPDFGERVRSIYASSQADGGLLLGLNDDQLVVVEGGSFRIA